MSNTSAPEREGSPPKTSDPALARAVAALGAGRYAEAAQAYSSVAARAPDSEVYRAIARLLETGEPRRLHAEPLGQALLPRSATMSSRVTLSRLVAVSAWLLASCDTRSAAS